jgi:hypothetical protein
MNHRRPTRSRADVPLMYQSESPDVNDNVLKSNNFLHKSLGLLADSGFLLDFGDRPIAGRG